MSNLILFGFKSAGKTYFGRRLAQAIDYTFVDIDEKISSLFGQNIPCREVYKKIGENAFRDLEHKAVFSLKNVTECIIATGGATLLDYRNYTLLQKLGKLVYLNAEKEVLKARILTGELPAFFDRNDPENYFEKVYQQRISQYEKIDALMIPLANKSDSQILDELKEALYGK